MLTKSFDPDHFNSIGVLSSSIRSILVLGIAKVLHASEKKDLGEEHKLVEDEANINHLDVGSCRQHLHLLDKDGRHQQHRRQVHPQSSLKEGRFEEHGSISWKT